MSKTTKLGTVNLRCPKCGSEQFESEAGQDPKVYGTVCAKCGSRLSPGEVNAQIEHIGKVALKAMEDAFRKMFK